MVTRQSRFWGILAGIVCLFFTVWVELAIQRQQHRIGGGLNRTILFLLINVHIVVIIALLYLIIRHSIKLFLERRKGSLGHVFKSNLLFAFILFSVIPSFFVFFTAGRFITKSIDCWFQAHVGRGFARAFELHAMHNHDQRAVMQAVGRYIATTIQTELQSEPLSASILQATLSKASDHCRDFFKSVPDKIYVLRHPQLAGVGSIQDEVKQWRTFRMFNDRTTKSLRQRFTQKLLSVTDELLFDFYGSLYWAKKIGDYYLILVHRYPVAIRSALIDLENAQSDFQQIESMRDSIFASYFCTFILLTLLILFLSIWCAFYLARGLSKPIQTLLEATEQLRQGRFDTHVHVDPSSDLQSLAQGFNEMKDALKQAQAQLIVKNVEMLSILENISSSVFLINNAGRVIFCNAAADRLVKSYAAHASCRNKKISIFGPSIITTFFGLIRDFLGTRKDFFIKEQSFLIGSELRTFMVYGRMLSIAQAPYDERRNLLIVIDDVTDIVKISTMRTWQGAAKQMAHEIKNPLTPIQLATQRLQRKYKNILDHDDVFMNCTKVILDHVCIIKDLVSHFAQFACMPALKITSVDIIQLLEEVLALYRMSYPEISFIIEHDVPSIIIASDSERLRRVFINLCDNSVRALSKMGSLDGQRAISLRVTRIDNKLSIIFSDNGPGILQSVRDSLFLPHVSTEKKNMGLGLAIVHDTITQLGGSIILEPSLCGAVFQIVLPVCNESAEKN